MTHKSYTDRQGNPLTDNEWAAKFKDAAYKILAKDETGDYEISTIWTGDPSGPFETIVFGLKGSNMRTYSTEDQAHAGHAEFVAWLNGKGPDPLSTFKDRATDSTDEAMRLIRDSVPGVRVIILVEGLSDDDNHIAVGNSRSGEEGEWSVGEMVDSLEGAARALDTHSFDARYGW